MKFEDLKLAYGYPLQLQINNSAGQSERFSSRFIGCLPGQGVLLSAPQLAGKPVRFRIGQQIIARMMVANGVGVFVGTLEGQSVEPYPILHLTYPEQVSFKGIRGATRVAVSLAVSVANLKLPDSNLIGLISDISISGARLELDRDVLGEVGDTLVLRAGVSIADINKEMVIRAVIRSQTERSAAQEGEPQNASVVYGLEFMENDEQQQLLLYAYVFSQIAREQMPSE